MLDRLVLVVAAIAGFSSAAFSQSFEVASLKPNGTECRGKKPVDPRQVRYTNYSLKGLVRDAYQVEFYQVDAPAWFDEQCYDVVAKPPEGAAKEQIPAMLQALLAERFHLRVHKEMKTERVYALVVAKGAPRLTEAAVKNGRTGGVRLSTDGHMEFSAATMASFASAMSSLLARPVVDKTEVQGFFDITLDVNRSDLAGLNIAAPEMENGAASSIFAAIQGLGLRLESGNAPLVHIVVDAAERTPIGN